jgi:predicted naringenin-chalcone synthase
MGCYAAMPAIRTAQGFVASHQLAERTSANQVDVVHTEMCSLHLNPSSDSVEQTIVHTLFADGNIKYSLTPAGSAKKGFGLYEMAEKIIPDTQDQMSWIPEFWGFQMTLGKRVPVYLKNNIREFVLELYKKAGWELGDEFSKTVFAVHPGGPKIIDVVEEALELSPSQVAASREILFERGNMSSATLPHVWERLLEKNLPSGTPVVSLAFGPGLTVFGSLFKVI